MSENDTQAEHSQILSTGIENYENLKDITTLVYLLQALFFVGFTPIIGLIINYFKRSDVKGSILESHFRWQIKNILVGFVLVLLGQCFNFYLDWSTDWLPILVIITIWWVYRFVRGWLCLNKDQPMYAS